MLADEERIADQVVSELLNISASLAQVISEGESVKTIEQKAHRDGFIPLTKKWTLFGGKRRGESRRYDASIGCIVVFVTSKETPKLINS